MNPQRFDNLIRDLGQSLSRRAALRAGATSAGGLALFRKQTAALADDATPVAGGPSITWSPASAVEGVELKAGESVAFQFNIPMSGSGAVQAPKPASMPQQLAGLDMLFQPQMAVAARKAQDDLGGSLGNTCSVMSNLAVALGREPIGMVGPGQGTNVPAVYFPATGEVFFQSNSGDGTPASGAGERDAVVTPIMVDTNWAISFLTQVTDLLQALEAQAGLSTNPDA